jgi:hypothetical protein
MAWKKVSVRIMNGRTAHKNSGTSSAGVPVKVKTGRYRTLYCGLSEEGLSVGLSTLEIIKEFSRRVGPSK